MTYEVLLTARAQRDLDNATEYIARSSPAAASRWRTELLEFTLTLENSPQTWALATETAAFPFELHEIFHRTRRGRATRLLFTIVGQQVRILAIRRPGQDLAGPADLQ